jgi:hypothetical protein
VEREVSAMMNCSCKGFFKKYSYTGTRMHRCRICGTAGNVSDEAAELKPDIVDEIKSQSGEGQKVESNEER